MNKLCTPFLVFLFLVCEGCGSWGGGGGKYYPPQVSINTMNLIKKNFLKSGVASCENEFVFTSDYDEFVKRQKVASEESMKIFGRDFSNICKFKFLKNKYILALSSSAKVIIFTERGNKIKELTLPRYPIECFAFSTILKNSDYLIIYINQQATSHSSTLIVFDEYFNIQYQEHLLGAKSISCCNSKKYGNFFVVKSEGFWFPNGHKVENPEVKINGDWLYYLK